MNAGDHRTADLVHRHRGAYRRLASTADGAGQGRDGRLVVGAHGKGAACGALAATDHLGQHIGLDHVGGHAAVDGRRTGATARGRHRLDGAAQLGVQRHGHGGCEHRIFQTRGDLEVVAALAHEVDRHRAANGAGAAARHSARQRLNSARLRGVHRERRGRPVEGAVLHVGQSAAVEQVGARRARQRVVFAARQRDRQRLDVRRGVGQHRHGTARVEGGRHDLCRARALNGVEAQRQGTRITHRGRHTARQRTDARAVGTRALARLHQHRAGRDGRAADVRVGHVGDLVHRHGAGKAHVAVGCGARGRDRHQVAHVAGLHLHSARADVDRGVVFNARCVASRAGAQRVAACGVGLGAGLRVSHRRTSGLAASAAHRKAQVAGQAKGVAGGAGLHVQAGSVHAATAHRGLCALTDQVHRGRAHARELAFGGTHASRHADDVGPADRRHIHVARHGDVAFELGAVGGLNVVVNIRQAQAGRATAQRDAQRAGHTDDAFTAHRALEFAGVTVVGRCHLVVGQLGRAHGTQQGVQRGTGGRSARLQGQVACEVHQGAIGHTGAQRVADVVEDKRAHELAPGGRIGLKTTHRSDTHHLLRRQGQHRQVVRLRDRPVRHLGPRAALGVDDRDGRPHPRRALAGADRQRAAARANTAAVVSHHLHAQRGGRSHVAQHIGAFHRRLGVVGGGGDRCRASHRDAGGAAFGQVERDARGHGGALARFERLQHQAAALVGQVADVAVDDACRGVVV